MRSRQDAMQYTLFTVLPCRRATSSFEKKIMRHSKQILTTFLVFLLAFIFEGCEKEEPEPEPVVVNKTSIAPASTDGRPNKNVGCVEIASRSTTISVWDKGTVDGDIISLIANGQTIISNFTLAGPATKKTVTYDFGANGFNYLVLYAHNEGSLSPNTAAISINGKEFQIDSYLTTNGYVDIIVTGFGVVCGSPGGGGSGTCSATDFTGTANCAAGSVAVATGICCPSASPFYCAGTNSCYATCEASDAACAGTVWKGTASTGGGTTTTGQALFWTRSDFGCGSVSVTYNGQSGSITSFYSGGAPGCGATGCATFTMNPGTYNYSASCTGKTWSGQVTISAGNCFKLELLK
jgi:hypothetical protein